MSKIICVHLSSSAYSLTQRIFSSVVYTTKKGGKLKCNGKSVVTELKI